MAFFDKINSIAKNVGDKTGDAIEMAKINARIASERSAMNDIYRQLGEVYYAHRVNGGEGEPAEAAAIYSQLDQRTAAIDEAQKQIVAIKAEGERRAAEAAAAEEAASADYFGLSQYIDSDSVIVWHDIDKIGRAYELCFDTSKHDTRIALKTWGRMGVHFNVGKRPGLETFLRQFT